jgi:hypothetical protein
MMYVLRIRGVDPTDPELCSSRSPLRAPIRLDFIRADIEHRRRQVQRLRGEIRQLRHSGIFSASAEALLEQMLDKLDQLCAERDRLKKEQPGHNKGKALGGRQW